MPAHPPTRPGQVFRHFTVAVFVVHAGAVLLHYHRKLGKWLPPGGHIEDDELPDDAAVREVLEETGVRARLVGGRGLPTRVPLRSTGYIDEPRQLVLPAGVQVERIYPGHEHIDLVYFAVADPDFSGSAEVDPLRAERDQVAWYSAAALFGLGASEEIQAWASRALDAISTA